MNEEYVRTRAYYNWLKNGPDSDPVKNWLDAEKNESYLDSVVPYYTEPNKLKHASKCCHTKGSCTINTLTEETNKDSNYDPVLVPGFDPNTEESEKNNDPVLAHVCEVDLEPACESNHDELLKHNLLEGNTVGLEAVNFPLNNCLDDVLNMEFSLDVKRADSN